MTHFEKDENIEQFPENVWELISADLDLNFIRFQTKLYDLDKQSLINVFRKSFNVDPNENFSSEQYLLDYPDVKEANLHPYEHFVRFGKNEVRHSKNSIKFNEYLCSSDYKITDKLEDASERDAGVFFDENFYNKTYHGAWGWKHYLQFGFKENKSPSRGLIPEVLDLYFKKGDNSETQTLPLLTMIKEAEDNRGRTCSSVPEMSIVILNWNKSIMTLQCVYTIFKNTYHDDIEIIIVDNGSSFEEFRTLLELRAFPCVKIIRNKTNRYYGEANNIGVEHSRSRNICLLNNDAFVGPDWDLHLLNELDSDNNIGGVGPKFLFPNGVLQEAGGALSPCGQNIQIGKGLDPNLEFFNRKTDVTHISAACFMMKRSVFDRVNGFDYRYEPAYFEDADLTAKITSLGLPIRYVPASEVIHVENATSKEPGIGFNFNELISVNRLKFVEKWGDYLRGGASPLIPDFTEKYSLHVEENNAENIAVVYSPYSLVPGGGERYVLSLAIAARDNGYKTFFCSPEKYSKYRFHTVAYELGLDVSNIHLMSEDQLNQTTDISLFVVMSNELSPTIAARGKKKNIYHCQFPFPMSDWHISTHLENVGSYDTVIVNSQFTKNAYENEAKKYFVTIPEVRVVAPPVSAITSHIVKDEKCLRILSVGRFIAGGHCKKQLELVKAFIEFQTAYKDKDVRLTLIGSLGPSKEDGAYLEEVRKISNSNVEIILNASRQTVVDCYKRSHIYWHGTGIGEDVTKQPEVFEHFGITPIEALSAGCIPVVWHQGGPREVLELLGLSDAHFAKSVSEYSKKTKDLISQNTKVNVDTGIFSSASFQRKLQEIIVG